MTNPENKFDQSVTTFSTFFDDFLTARCEQIMSEQVLIDPEYRQFDNDKNKAAETLRGFLNESQKQCYYDLDSAEGMSLNLAVILVYKQGLKDGLKLRELLGIE